MRKNFGVNKVYLLFVIVLDNLRLCNLAVQLMSSKNWGKVMLSFPLGGYFVVLGLRANNISNSLVDLSGLVAVTPKPRIEARMVLASGGRD